MLCYLWKIFFCMKTFPTQNFSKKCLMAFISLDFWKASQLTFTYLESTMEASMCEIYMKTNVWNMLKVNNKGTKTTWMTLFWCLFLWLQRHPYNAVEHLRWNFFVKIVNSQNQAGIYLLKVNNRNNRTRCKIYSKLTINAPE